MKQVAAGDDCAVRSHQQRSEAADLLGYADAPRRAQRIRPAVKVTLLIGMPPFMAGFFNKR
ncbi:hypothetical protein [Ralstonia solanacearum]|uniref:hypothetical protein n=1 Tax=Ralstonia solanacearum TaxID=305 RepID=UPI0012D85096|nr:hypothetical protein [Ralstonia solanacearum]